jgi:sulfite reductase (ferredoxin)
VRFYDSQKFFDPFSVCKFAYYLFFTHAESTEIYTQDSARYLIDEAQLFIDAAHSCYNRISAPAHA